MKNIFINLENTDFSGQTMSFMISPHQDEHDRLIAAGGKKSNAAESAYGSTKGEMAALVYGVTKFYHYLSLNHFIIKTDNQSLHPTNTLIVWPGLSCWN